MDTRTFVRLAPVSFGILALVPNLVLAQVSWTDRTAATNPPPRYGHAMTHDTLRNRTVLFGGYGISDNRGDTWQWDGASWTQMTPTVAPAPRRRPAMAFDSARGVSVLFGGYSGWAVYADTWEWDGATWTQRTPVHFPNARDSHAMAYDPVRQRIVLFGGSVGTTVNDTWEYDGIDWQQKTPTTRPAIRVDGRMDYMATLGKVVLFGGYDPVWRNDTWAWDGVNWTQLSTATQPPARAGHGLAYDPVRQRLVLFGGARNTTVWSDTWEFDGIDWTQQSPTPSAPGRGGIVMAHDPARGVCTVFGGYSTSAVTNNTWEYGPTQPANDECAGAVPLVLGNNGMFHNLYATTSAPMWGCAAGGNDVWFTYTANCTGPHTFRTCGASFDTAIEVFAGDCNTLTSLGCNDDAGTGPCAFTLQSAVTVNLVDAVTYYIRVGGFFCDEGSFPVEVLRGTGSGSFTTEFPGCGLTTLVASGDPNVTGTVNFTLGNLSGLGPTFLGLGLAIGNTPFCTCIVGHDWFAAFFATSLQLTIPCDPIWVGTAVGIQGAEFGVAGCPAPLLTFTDTIRMTIG